MRAREFIVEKSDSKTPKVNPNSFQTARVSYGKAFKGKLTRNKEAQKEIILALTKAAEDTNLYVRISSAGQDETGSDRHGSHRHDHGMAVDFHVYPDFESAREQNPLDRLKNDDPEMFEFLKIARRYGLKGLGAGYDGMGDTTIHLDITDQSYLDKHYANDPTVNPKADTTYSYTDRDKMPKTTRYTTDKERTIQQIDKALRTMG
jgi:hypothetical protein